MQVEKSEVESKVMQVIHSIVDNWNEEIEDDITTESLLVEDIGFASIDFVQLSVEIEKKFDCKLGFQELLMQQGAYVEDLSVQQIVDFVHIKIHQADSVPVEKVQSKQVLLVIDEAERITAEKIQQFKKIIKPLAHRENNTTEKNAPVGFILSPPRSGSTLLRIMLAGSPQLFVPPELHLLSYNDMAQRKQALNDEQNNHLLEGAIRGLMQLRGWNSEQARQFVADCEDRALSCKQFYKMMQSTMGSRILVDKTPSYAFKLDILKRAEEDFESAMYIHLTRHPCGTIRSYEESKLTRLTPFMEASGFSGRQLAEMVWLTSHQNILEFAQLIPKERFISLSYEDLVTNPKQQLLRICQFLNIEFHEDMLNPYENNEKRMAGGADVVSKMSGDLKFHLHQEVDPSAATRWQQFYSEDMLGDLTKETAAKFGYIN